MAKADSSFSEVQIARLKELEAENARLKKIYAKERIKAEILKEAIEKSGSVVTTTSPS